MLVSHFFQKKMIKNIFLIYQATFSKPSIFQLTFWIFNLLGPKTKMERLNTNCKMSSDVNGMAMKCADNLSQCLIQNRQSVVISKRQFLSEYYYPVPFGWPSYSHALDIQLKQNKSPCLID